VAVGQPSTCTATVTDTASSDQDTPTGTVKFGSDGAGSFSADQCTLSGSGTSAHCSVTYTPSAADTGSRTITAGYSGATGRLGVQPDLITLAKSIGGGFPVGAFGGKAEYMDLIATGKVLHLGTYNGNPLVMAAVKAVLTEACNPDAMAEAMARNGRLVQACQDVIDRTGVPAHTVQFGAKGCVTWSRTPVRNYRDYLATNFDLAFAQWIHGINRGVLLPPGLDEQWLISVMHDEADAMRYATVFAEFVDELVA